MRCACGEMFPRSAYIFCPDCGRRVPKRTVNTGGGLYVEGDVVCDGDMVAGDKIVVQNIERVEDGGTAVALDLTILG